MFESLQEKLNNIFKKLRSRGKLNETDLNEVLREVRLALLEADVNLKVVKEFISKVKEKAFGAKLWESLTPGQLVIKFVKDELIEIMGSHNSKLNLAPQDLTIIMLIGLHGSGKTTTCAKLAGFLKNKAHNPLLVSCDIYRPAAALQIKTLGEKLDIPVYIGAPKDSPLEICKKALEQAKKQAKDVIIIDTAGRLHIDESLMQELIELKNCLHPNEILLVADAMTGQEAVNIAENFNKNLEIDGIILTKLDGDARGGAALSIKFVTGKPIKFVGIGEKLDTLEPFYPDRMASRILGMGDILGLIEKAEISLDLEKARNLEKKIKTQEFTLLDFLEQIQQIKKMGPLDQILAMIPGFSQMKQFNNLQIDEKEFKHLEAIIYSMTPYERNNPHILNAGRKRRISQGSGTDVALINRLLKQFEMLKKTMKQFGEIGKKSNPLMKIPFFQ